MEFYYSFIQYLEFAFEKDYKKIQEVEERFTQEYLSVVQIYFTGEDDYELQRKGISSFFGIKMTIISSIASYEMLMLSIYQ